MVEHKVLFEEHLVESDDLYRGNLDGQVSISDLGQLKATMRSCPITRLIEARIPNFFLPSYLGVISMYI